MARMVILFLGVMLILNAATFLLVAVPTGETPKRGSDTPAAGAGVAATSLKALQRDLKKTSTDLAKLQRSVERLPRELQRLGNKLDGLSRSVKTMAGNSVAPARTNAGTLRRALRPSAPEPEVEAESLDSSDDEEEDAEEP